MNFHQTMKQVLNPKVETLQQELKRLTKECRVLEAAKNVLKKTHDTTSNEDIIRELHHLVRKRANRIDELKIAERENNQQPLTPEEYEEHLNQPRSMQNREFGK